MATPLPQLWQLLPLVSKHWSAAILGLTVGVRACNSNYLAAMLSRLQKHSRLSAQSRHNSLNKHSRLSKHSSRSRLTLHLCLHRNLQLHSVNSIIISKRGQVCRKVHSSRSSSNRKHRKEAAVNKDMSR